MESVAWLDNEWVWLGEGCEGLEDEVNSSILTLKTNISDSAFLHCTCKK